MARPDKLSQQILEVLTEQHSLTAPEVVQQLQKKGFSYNKTSVYRALERLLEQNQVCRYMFSGTTATYERRDHHHDHMVCEICGSVQTVPCSTTLPEQIEEFQVDHHHLTMFGVCARCSGKV